MLIYGGNSFMIWCIGLCIGNTLGDFSRKWLPDRKWLPNRKGLSTLKKDCHLGAVLSNERGLWKRTARRHCEKLPHILELLKSSYFVCHALLIRTQGGQNLLCSQSRGERVWTGLFGKHFKERINKSSAWNRCRQWSHRCICRLGGIVVGVEAKFGLAQFDEHAPKKRYVSSLFLGEIIISRIK